ncbi:MAG: 2-oxoglutarate dehydrogenase, E2 component, dihydrolipoamide succinyltransferase [Acidobacteriaceae bacterium]|nr:2-oxoglutarate dehydrogenase, E2 component, dihydrolipoamide succinyltransferase [Acidobacteriaceae bacterium]MBV9779684.1 2-oxoglutarate dehydrogenase, E2 component, dihydrolipoamide succinyltransferase [Acidobacteriaceae bacterium]
MTDVVMPQMGESIVEGTLTRWLKKPGEKVERDEPLFEISTDKVDTEIPAPVSGVLSEVLVNEGATVAINAVVARIGEGDGASAGASAPKQEPPNEEAKPAPDTKTDVEVGPSAASPEARRAKSAPPPPQPAPPPGRHTPVATSAGPYPIQPEEPRVEDVTPPSPSAQADGSSAPVSEEQGPLSPLVRKMAREYNIDLSRVKGTGAGGRITKQDLESYMSSQAGKAYGGVATSAPAEPVPTQRTAAPAPAAPAPAPMPLAESAKTRVEPMSIMRQKIAEHMVMSRRTSAHVTTVHRVDMTKIAKLRDRSKAEFQARNGFSLTYLPFVTAAAAESLRAFPIFNGSIDGKNIVYFRDINIGIAVALEGGLIVPVIRNADEKNVAGLQRAIVDLATRARSRQLKPEEVQGGTFSITNFGSFGSIFATPVINQPQVAILGVGAVEKIPAVVDGDAIAIRSQAHLALTFDHRLIDGALADQFCQKVKSILESWSREIL